MHLEILVEDQFGKKALEILIPAIIDKSNTYRIHAYKGIGRIPKNLKSGADARKRILLDQLPRILRGYGKTYPSKSNCKVAIFLVCDLDNKCLKTFRQELFNTLNACDPQPETRFCIAIEETEAWFLGDIAAIKSAYPKAKEAVLKTYENDSICGTWEILAEAVFGGGLAALSSKGGQAVGAEKSQWAEKITPHMDIKNNASPSFAYFRKKLLELAGEIA